MEDVDWDDQSIKLKDTPKRDNLTVFFEDECSRVLQRWMQVRGNTDSNGDALFLNQEGERLRRHGVYDVVTKYVEQVGLHDQDSNTLDERFTPHCTRLWFTMHLRRSGMQRENVTNFAGIPATMRWIRTPISINRNSKKLTWLTFPD